MPLILKQLLSSEKFLYAVLLWQIPMLVFVFMGKVSIEAWREDALWALGILIGGKTVQGTAATIVNGKQPPTDGAPPKIKLAKKEP